VYGNSGLWNLDLVETWGLRTIGQNRSEGGGLISEAAKDNGRWRKCNERRWKCNERRWKILKACGYVGRQRKSSECVQEWRNTAVC